MNAATRGYRTIGDAVLDHVEQTNGGSGGTEVGVRLLELEGVEPPERRYSAANIYLAALSIIREQAAALAEEKQEHQATLGRAAFTRERLLHAESLMERGMYGLAKEAIQEARS